MALHANHAREMTDDAKAACARLINAGIAMISQTVLLRGVNDDAAVLGALMRAFVENRIKPYYLHHPDLAPGTGHFRLHRGGSGAGAGCAGGSPASASRPTCSTSLAATARCPSDRAVRLDDEIGTAVPPGKTVTAIRPHLPAELPPPPPPLIGARLRHPPEAASPRPVSTYPPGAPYAVDAWVGFVARRGFWTTRRLADQFHEAGHRVRPVALLRAVACAVMTISPSFVSRLPASLSAAWPPRR